VTESREQHAVAAEHDIGDWEKLLAELDNGEEQATLIRPNPKLATEIRSLQAAVRSEIATIRTEISELRRRPAEHVMPISLTTRRRPLA
jgi:hypothetical protein